ncbi:alpha-1,2-fucosyltransferase [Pseudomonadota bacterium]
MIKKDAFVMNIIGGLGNQMFQYAYIKSLSKRIGRDFLLDFSSFDFYKLHKPIIKSLNIENKIASKEVLIDYKTQEIKSKCPKLFRKILRIKKFKIISSKFKTFKEQENAPAVFDKAFFSLSEAGYIIGYFQSEKYFKNIRRELLKDFLPKNGFSEKFKQFQKQIKNKKFSPISLHIRRGDYVSNSITKKVYGHCPLSYYEKAVKILQKSVKNPKLFIFSDDLKWVKENLKINLPMIFVNCATPSTPYEDIWLMASCDHNIIANSSFSWWGAWLNENPKKIVIAPKKWFAKKDLKYKDIYCRNWKKI